MTKGSRPKLKWTEQMNRDLLECKKKAKELVASGNPPCRENGNKKGYIAVMTELWVEKGYEHLGIKSQNLRDQASRLEKMNDSIGETCDTDATNGGVANGDNVGEQPALGGFQRNLFTPPQQESDDFENRENTSQNANLDLANFLNLHTAIEPPTENNSTAENVQQQQESEAMTDDVLSEARADVHAPGHLPDFRAVDMPSIISWGRRADGTIITVNSSTIIKAYDEITQWRKNTFLVPYGKVGREFIDQLTQHITEWNNASHAQHIALKATIVLLATALQKPSMKSKAKDHQECLTKRLALWKEGEIESLLREGRSIQKRILKTKRAKPPDKARIFAKLVMQGQINSALRYLSDDDCGGVLPLTDDVMRQLHEKHPEAQDAKLGSILFGPVEEVHDSLYQQIDGEMIREAALRTKGSGGPSGVDANGFKRILTCKSFKKSSANLCDALATMTRKLCTEYIDPRTIEPILANRLIPLDKGEGAVRPIGVGEVIRRVIGKCVMKVTKEDVLDASGSLQVCAGLRSGSEAAVHAMHSIFEEEETDAVLLIDASNAFNALNRAAALHNIRVVSTHSNLRNQYVPATGETVYNGRKRAQIRRRHNIRGSLGDGDLRHQPSTLDYTLRYLQ